MQGRGGIAQAGVQQPQPIEPHGRVEAGVGGGVGGLARGLEPGRPRVHPPADLEPLRARHLQERQHRQQRAQLELRDWIESPRTVELCPCRTPAPSRCVHPRQQPVGHPPDVVGVPGIGEEIREALGAVHVVQVGRDLERGHGGDVGRIVHQLAGDALPRLPIAQREGAERAGLLHLVRRPERQQPPHQGIHRLAPAFDGRDPRQVHQRFFVLRIQREHPLECRAGLCGRPAAQRVGLEEELTQLQVRLEVIGVVVHRPAVEPLGIGPRPRATRGERFHQQAVVLREPAGEVRRRVGREAGQAVLAGPLGGDTQAVVCQGERGVPLDRATKRLLGRDVAARAQLTLAGEILLQRVERVGSGGRDPR